MCLSVCLSVMSVCLSTTILALQATTHVYVRYQQLQCYMGMQNNVAILLKRLRPRDMACKQAIRPSYANSHWLYLDSFAQLGGALELVTQGEYRLPRAILVV